MWAGRWASTWTALTPSHAPERLREAGFDPDAPLTKLWVELTVQLHGFPRHLSQHPGGFLIARDDIAFLVPVENAAMDHRTVIQWDKDDLDALRLIKVDVLALGMLSAIRRALAWVVAKEPARWRPLMQQAVPGAPLQLPRSSLPDADDHVYDMLCDADSVGVFQVESRAQMSMLPRLRPREFYDLVIEVAIVRPGPIQGGMVHPYLKRRSGEEPVSFPSEESRTALGRTEGVPIFQEQVMQLAILAADFTPGEADQLRRGMAAWKRQGGMGPFRDKLVGRMVAKGYERDYAEAIFRQIEGFGEYGFPESHAASFALLVYVSAWLKRHHPDAFLASLLDSLPMGFYGPAQLVRDARAHGVTVLPVCVMSSEAGSVLVLNGAPPGEPAPATLAHSPPPASLRAVRLGLNRLVGLGADATERIVAARAQAPFTSVEDLTRRAALDAHALQCLADGNALVALAGHRRQAAWAVAGMDTRPTALLHATRTVEDQAPALELPTAGAELMADYRRIRLSLTSHPLALLRTHMDRFKVLPAALLQDCRSGQLARASGLVTHRQQPPTAKGVVFVTLEDDTGPINVIVWPQVAQAQRQPLLAARLMTVFGVWQKQGGVAHLIAKKLVDHTALLQGLSTRSRDFH
jgi:error-prone DNA polymerase